MSKSDYNTMSPLPPIPNTPQNHSRIETPDQSSQHLNHPANLSLRVCKQCQNTLLNAFEHCLSKQQPSHSFMDSMNQIDEVEDGKQLTDPPYFNLIKDPTIKKNTLFINAADKIERDRASLVESKKQKNLSITPQANKALVSATSGGSFNHVFSGSLYKRTLEAKAKQIQTLQEKLYEKTASEKIEHQNVERLLIALNKSMKYYAYAEEWQMDESSRLQYDVRCLKAEMSCLMAFLINSEEEKRLLNIKTQEIEKQIHLKTLKITEIEKETQETKVKLHDAYKDYLVMTETMARLEKEAEQGSELVRSRNIILQRNLDQLSKEFEATSKELASGQLQIKELEFELEEMASQFNAVGEGKKNLEVETTRLQDALATTTRELKSFIEKYESASGKAQMLEESLKEMTNKYVTSKNDLEKQVDTLTSSLDTSTKENKTIWAKLVKTEQEFTTTVNQVHELTDKCSGLEHQIRVLEKNHKKEMKTKLETITELLNIRIDDGAKIKRLENHKEQLIFQVNDLQANLERETINISTLNFELTQMKRSTDELISNLEIQLERSNAAKTNLANDKRQLIEKVKQARLDLTKKEDEYEALNATSSKQRDEAKVIEEKLQAEIDVLKAQVLVDKETQRNFEARNEEMNASNLKTQTQIDQLTSQKQILEKEQIGHIETIARVNKEKAILNEEFKLSKTFGSETKSQLETALNKINELNVAIKRQDDENNFRMKKKEKELTTVTEAYEKTKVSCERFEKGKNALEVMLRQLAEELEKMRVDLVAERKLNEQLEYSLSEVRKSHGAERKFRLDLERMKMKVNRCEEEKRYDNTYLIKDRIRRLDDVSERIRNEEIRLFEVAKLLPNPIDVADLEHVDLRVLEKA